MNGFLRDAVATPAPEKPAGAGNTVDENVAGNARLTALTGSVLLTLFTAEVVTVILGVDHVLTAHVAIGFALAPVVLLKIGSTGWRFLRYYRGDPAYVRRGAPPTALRLLGPVLVVVTTVLVGSGMLAYLGPHALHGPAVATHKVVFYPWLALLLLHATAHFAETARLAGAELTARVRDRLAGAAARRYVLLVVGTVLALTLSVGAGHYLLNRPGSGPDSRVGVPAARLTV